MPWPLSLSTTAGEATALGKTALKLPAHERVELAVLVNGSVNAGEKAVCFEATQMFLEIERRAGEFFSMWLFRLVGSIEHALPFRKLFRALNYDTSLARQNQSRLLRERTANLSAQPGLSFRPRNYTSVQLKLGFCRTVS